jgi:hypothetical protein
MTYEMSSARCEGAQDVLFAGLICMYAPQT